MESFRGQGAGNPACIFSQHQPELPTGLR
ncbi:cyclic lactone autoinducer peptide [Proteiniphilum sp. X52]|nr:cyclic lactone autoinducer peptide [Proteiniphilum sp. X52]